MIAIWKNIVFKETQGFYVKLGRYLKYVKTCQNTWTF